MRPYTAAVVPRSILATAAATVAVIVASTAALACHPTPSATPPDATTDSAESPESPALRAALDGATAGVTDPVLIGLLREHWAQRLQDYPQGATRLGVHDYDDRLTDHSASAIAQRRQQRDAFAKRADAIDAAALSAADQETLQLWRSDLADARARDVCRNEAWNVGVQANLVSNAVKLHHGFTLATPADGANLVARYRAVSGVVDDRIAALTLGLADGLVANRTTLTRLLALVDRQLAEPTDGWAMLKPTDAGLQAWPDVDRDAFQQQLQAAVTEDVRPAFVRYRDFIQAKLLPAARGEDAAGIVHLPLGKACYAAQIQHHTTLPLTAAAVHQIGLDEIARIDAEITALGARALGTSSLSETLARLRTDPTLYFTDEAEVEGAAKESLAAAITAMPKFFGIVPKAGCVVRRVPDFEAPQTHIGYYEPPHADGSKPGEYFVNVYAPTTRPRFEARVLAVHESIPGHHLQTAIAQELEALPAFRRHGGYSAFVEGWALYTERLADEMGLYADDLDRMGMLSFDAWRAGRLVVDTGIHAKGWTRAQAEAYLVEHTALTQTNIENEVDRYIGWPGQALGYKIGQRHLWELRAEAEAALHDQFSLPEFHDVVLERGAVTLELLSARVHAWTAAKLQAATRRTGS